MIWLYVYVLIGLATGTWMAWAAWHYDFPLTHTKIATSALLGTILWPFLWLFILATETYDRLRKTHGD